MRRGRVFIYLALVIILLLAAGYLVWTRVIQPQQARQQAPETAVEAEPTPTPVPVAKVVVLTQPLARGAIIRYDDTLPEEEQTVQLREYPENLILPTMFQEIALVVGRRAKFDLDGGTVLTAGMLVDSVEELPLTGSVAAMNIPPGYVAVSVPISRLSSVSYAPRPGDHVSVIMTMLMVDLDNEFQSKLPNTVSGVLAPGPAALLGNMSLDESGTNTTDAEGRVQIDQQGLNVWRLDTDPMPNIVTSQIAYGGTLALRGRTEIDPIINELFYILPAETQRARLVSQTFLPDVMVLQVGNFLLPEEEEALRKAQEEPVAAAPAEEEAQANQQQAANQQQTESAQVTPPDVITIVVKPQDAVMLNYLLYSGAELTFALRSSGDTAVESTEAATLQYLLDEYNIPSPVKLPYGIEPRVDVLIPPVLENDIPEE